MPLNGMVSNQPSLEANAYSYSFSLLLSADDRLQNLKLVGVYNSYFLASSAMIM